VVGTNRQPLTPPENKEIEMNLSDASTKDLVEELSKREAVQRIDVAPHTQKVEIAVSESGKFPFDKIFEGPQIILRVWD
jgi:hypothetical protein